jgi:hypothetical protein
LETEEPFLSSAAMIAFAESNLYSASLETASQNKQLT